jgi:hypothetical protein
VSPVASAKGEGYDLIIPIPEKGMGTPILTAVVAPVATPVKPRLVSKLKIKVKKVFVETQNSTLKTQNSPTPVSSSPSSSVVSDNPMDVDKAFVLNFAQALYSIGYLNYQDRETTLLGWVTKDYAGDLKGHYFNPYVLKNMESIHRTRTFTPDAPVKWISSNEMSEEFIVSGTINLQGAWNGQASNSTKTVTAHIQVIHDLKGNPVVKKINEQLSD